MTNHSFIFTDSRPDLDLDQKSRSRSRFSLNLTFFNSQTKAYLDSPRSKCEKKKELFPFGIKVISTAKC